MLKGLCFVSIATLTMAAAACAQSPAGNTAPAAGGAVAAPVPVKARAAQGDWANLEHYRAANAELAPPPAAVKRVVFMGDSITDGWGRWTGTGDFFPGKPYVNRGISGQTTSQMLLRFEQDVVHLLPSAVVILGGTNDIAGNQGPSTPEQIEDNLAAMAAIAKANGIAVILASIPPAARYAWKPEVEPVQPTRMINAWMRSYCERNGCTYLDYYSALADENGAMLPGLSTDGVHPLAKGYALMQPLAESAINRALQASSARVAARNGVSNP